ncbi:MAG: Wzt carbohydrate-binding domain-containing protein, partial [Acidimicrobiia bacterium]|nr:Wzt carbohydrate-binding domain-containing protein [Acidimicrobiia bacterium]
HSPDMVRLFCDRAVILDSGRMIYCGEPHDGVVAYRDSLEARTGVRHGDGTPTELSRSSNEVASLVSVTVDRPTHGGESYHPGDTVTFRVRYAAAQAIPALRLAIWIYSHDGILVSNFNGSDITGVDLMNIEPGVGEVAITIDDLPLLQGSFEITAALQEVNETFEYDRAEAPTSFSVTSPGGAGAGRVRLKTSIDHAPSGEKSTSAAAETLA